MQGEQLLAAGPAAYEPASQGEQEAAEAGDVEPGEQSVHELEPATAANVPGAQPEQLVPPMELLMVPCAHGTHPAEPAEGAMYPGAQLVHDTAAALLNRPGAQLTQAPPAVPLYWPALHGVHEVEPAALLVPGLHDVQLVAPAELEKVPEGHGAQVPADEKNPGLHWPHVAPPEPGLQAHAPVVPHVPRPPHVVDARQNVEQVGP